MRDTTMTAITTAPPRNEAEPGRVSVHDIMISEPHPCRRGFFRRIYARVEVANTGSYFVWRQIDENGLPMTDAERAFASEDAALDDAVKSLNGVAVTF
jgi:hypothetical protein